MTRLPPFVFVFLAAGFFAASPVLVGCGGEAAETKREPSGEEFSSEGLVGTDRDGNGVRDDVGAYVRGNYSGAMQQALLQFARAETAFLLAAGSEEEALAAEEDRSHAQYCAYSIGGAGAFDHVNEVKARILNTEKRSAAHVRADAHLSGKVFEGPNTTEDLSDYCE